jgi:hypothetical protein
LAAPIHPQDIFETKANSGRVAQHAFGSFKRKRAKAVTAIFDMGRKEVEHAGFPEFF